MTTGGSEVLVKEMADSLRCSLCRDIFINPRALPCQHAYCRNCLEQHIAASQTANQIRCPLCNIYTTVQEKRADGFPVAFHQESQLEIYHKMVSMNLGTQFSKFEGVCQIHKKNVSDLCKTCNKLICGTCLTTLHTQHSTTDLKSAETEHRPIVDQTRKELDDQKASKEKYIQEIKQAMTVSDHYKDEGIQKVKKQEEILIKEFTKKVQDHVKTIIDDIIHQRNKAHAESQAIINRVQAETIQLQHCISHIESQRGTEAGIVKISLEDVANCQDILKGMGHKKPIRHFTVKVDCPSLTVLQDQVAVVGCQLVEGPSIMVNDIPIESSKLERVANIPTDMDKLASGPSARVADNDIPTGTIQPGSAPLRASSLKLGPSTRMANIPNRPTSLIIRPTRELADIPPSISIAMKVTVKKLHRFDIDFVPSGMTCTPAGNVVVCKRGSHIVRMYTPKGSKVMDLHVPRGTEARDVESTETNIYVTDSNTESVLVFDNKKHLFKSSGKLVTTNNISNLRGIRGISISNRKMFITGATSENVIQLDMLESNKLSTLRQFAAGVQLKQPTFLCARGDVVAISSCDDHCVHCVDLSGRIKYTYGTPGKEGKSQNQLSRPRGVVFDEHNILFVADEDNNKVCVVSDSGRSLGRIDLGEYRLETPRAVTIDTEGNLLVACYTAGTFCIVKFGYSLNACATPEVRQRPKSFNL